MQKMNWTARIFFAAVTGAIAGCGVPETPAPDNSGANGVVGTDGSTSNVEVSPQIPDGFVFRPTFVTTQGDIEAGTAFAVTLPSGRQPMLLSAIHLYGPAGGLDENVPASRIAEITTRVTISPSFMDGESTTFDADVIPIIDAAPVREPSGAGDIVAIRIPPSVDVEPLQLAERTPPPGTPVWLAASILEGAPPSKRLHRATVTKNDTDVDILFYEFDDPNISLQATSGAPVVDASGAVVAINLSGGDLDGRLLGAGNPVGRFRPYLERASGPDAR